MDAFYGILEGIHVFLPAVAVIVCVLVVFFFGLGGATPKSIQPPSEYLKQIKQYPEKVKPKKPVTSKPVKTTQPARQLIVDKKSKSSSTSFSASNVEKSKAGKKTDRTPKKELDDLNDDVNNGWVMVTPRRRKKQTTEASSEPAAKANDAGGKVKKKKKAADKSSHGSAPPDVAKAIAPAALEPSEDEMPSMKRSEKKPKRDKKQQRRANDNNNNNNNSKNVGITVSVKKKTADSTPVEPIADGVVGSKKKRRARREA